MAVDMHRTAPTRYIEYPLYPRLPSGQRNHGAAPSAGLSAWHRHHLIPEPVLLSIDIAHIGFQSSEHEVFKWALPMHQRHAPELTKYFSTPLYESKVDAAEVGQ